MKKIIIIYLFIFVNLIQSQEIKTIELLPPESIKHNDFSFLKDELKGRNIVMLGEETHMYGNIFEMKARIIEYLHQELGYSTIAMEASMYDIWKMNNNGFNKKDFNNAIFGVWSSSIEFQRLVNYINKNNIKVIGFDSQVMNTSLFIDDFFDYLKEQNIVLELDEDDMGIIIDGVLENVTIEENDIKYSIYERELKNIIKQIEKLKKNETNYYWKQFVKSLLASSQDPYYNKKRILTMDFGNKNDNIRDKQMADNLLSYINRYPKEKIICWADNIHIMNDNSSIKKPITKDFIPMGSYIKKSLKNKMYSLATIHANDSILNPEDNQWYTTPIKQKSFEYELNKLEKPYLFITSNQKIMQLPKQTRLLNFIDFTEARLDQLHDGYIFFKNATLPKGENVNRSNKKLINIDKRVKQTPKGETITIKGWILDEKSEEPIPFATLILKKEEIYRVADENGFYEFSVKKKMMQNASVAFSSMGYESKIIPLNKLNNKTYLNPKFEKLEEVVLVGHLSPKTVLKKAILKNKVNHPIKPFNFYRYAKVLENKNNVTESDLELITKNCDYGYLSRYVITQRVEQIKWNKKINSKRYKNTSKIFFYRENAIRYANILHKRKYKKFELSFVKSNDLEDEGLYIVSFQTKRNKWNYTNRWYPTNYSGRIYIDKENFAIVKVVENWETSLDKNEINEHFKEYQNYRNIIQTTIKEENICYYSDIMGDSKYYATKFFNRSYSETINKDNKRENIVYERDSYLFNFELEDVEEIEYYEYNNKKENSLKRVKYDESFWNAFYKEKLKE